MATTDDRRSITELKRMDEAEARSTLTVDEFERWEKLTELHDEADATREQWADEDAIVAELTVHADKEALGTSVEVFGNDLLVHVDPEDDTLVAAHDRLEALRGEDEADEDLLDDETRREVGDALTTMLDAVLERWNGHDWGDLPEDDRDAVLAETREKWGIDGLMQAWVHIAAAVREDREEHLSVVESFRGAERRGRR